MIIVERFNNVTAQDRSQLWSLVITSFPEDERPSYPQFMDMARDTNILVARELLPMSNDIVGFVMMTRYMHEWPYIWMMAVDEDYRGIPGGAACQLMNTVLALYKHRDIYLHCKLSNIIAQKFYRKHGFVDVNVAKNHYPTEDGLLMMRRSNGL